MERHIREIRIARRVDQVTDHRVLFQLIGTVDKVLPHQEFGEGEGAEHDVLGHLEARNVPDLPADLSPDAGHVHARMIAGQRAIQTVNVEAHVLTQHLQQRRVEARLVIMQDEARSGPDRFALQFHRDQDQRCPVHLVLAVLTPPVEKAERQEQRVGPTLLQVRLGLAVEIDQSLVQIGGIGAHEHLVALKAAHDEFALDPFAGSLRVDIGVAHGPGGQIGQRRDADLLAIGQTVLQRAGIGTDERDRLSAHALVEQRVAGGQIEQPALPPVQAALRCQLFLGCPLVLTVEVGKVGRRFQVGQHRDVVICFFRLVVQHALGKGQRPNALIARPLDIDGADKVPFFFGAHVCASPLHRM